MRERSGCTSVKPDVYADFVRREIENEVRTAELKELAKKPALLEEVKESLTETADALKDTEQALKEDATSDSEASSTEEKSEDPPEKTEQTLGDMARASWADPPVSEAAEKTADPAPADDTLDPTPSTEEDERPERAT